MDTHAMRLMRLELHDMPSMGETLISAHGLSEKKKKEIRSMLFPWATEVNILN